MFDREALPSNPQDGYAVLHAEATYTNYYYPKFYSDSENDAAAMHPGLFEALKAMHAAGSEAGLYRRRRSVTCFSRRCSTSKR